MRIANLQGRAALVVAEGFIDIGEASDGQFSSDTSDVIANLDAFRIWAAQFDHLAPNAEQLAALATDERLSTVVARPRQIFAIGLNYRHHAEEMNLILPDAPMVFTKFQSALCGTHATIPVVSDSTDWEVEMVAVVGRGGRDIAIEDALDAVAGYCVGQDVSDRELQMAGAQPQFSLGKSWSNFAPVGPWITTSDEIGDPNELTIQCALNGVLMQDWSTNDMVFSIKEVVSYLSSVVELLPGDLIFTGSPHGVGQGQKPPRFLKAGDELVSTIQGLGSIVNPVGAY